MKNVSIMIQLENLIKNKKAIYDLTIDKRHLKSTKIKLKNNFEICGF